MKNIIAILLILVLASFGLFAADPTEDTPPSASITVNSNVADFSAFGVTSGKIANSRSFNSIAFFQEDVSSTIPKTISMLDLKGFVLVGYLSGINNTATKVDLTISVNNLISGTNSVELQLQSTEASIPAAANSKYGMLKDFAIRIQEKNAGDAALAPAGTYNTTITISLITG